VIAMQLHLRNRKIDGETHWAGTLDAGHLLKERSDIAGWGPLRADLSVKEAAGAVEVGGRLELELALVCSRCLEHVEHKLEIPFREAFVPAAEGTPDAEDDHVHPVSEDKVDLRPYVEENVLLALPFVPLCREDCKGLCPECGQNFNVRECDCRREEIDPRFSALEQFFKKET